VKPLLGTLAVIAMLMVTREIILSQDSGARVANFAGAAGDSSLDAATRAIASELRCPVCQGVSIQDSPSELAQEMRSIVREQLQAGKTPEQIKAYFVSKYGEWILLEPKPSGMNLVLYLLPALLVIGGVAGVGFLVRKWTRSGGSPA
jgi:cytochrome c-type biogenesis protein CcmH